MVSQKVFLGNNFGL